MRKVERLFLNIVVFLMCIAIFNNLVHSEKIKIKTENGVTVIYNPKNPVHLPGVPNRLRLIKEFSIGEKVGKKEYMFTKIILDVNDEGNIYVLDSKECNIKIFNEKGNFLKMFGQKGQGPGEFSSPRYIQITPHKEIMVYDLYARRINFFSLNGEYLREVSVAVFPLFLDPKIDSERNIIGVVMERQPGVKSTTVRKLIKFSTDLKPIIMIDKVISSHPGAINLFPPRIYFDLTKENNIIYGISDNYEIKVINPKGKLIKKIIKRCDLVKIGQKDKKEKIKEIFGKRGIIPGINVKFPKYFPAFWSLSIDEEGRIFIGTYEKVKDKKGYYYFDVFDSVGRYIAKIPLKIKPKQWFVWKNKKLYVVEETEEGFPIIQCYKVIWH
ncbi:6-bladed beta-propeller [Candidatus Aminicenantes bacterium AC-335-K20]|nr:6-bladed beta-propeller [SCandidatus Aminicenantes bacterium Aminicenantia_JdfR_composite]MCP2597570.1 6-bladed beta-propeller [Candidatus Aminicenantes bacterium AC-335-G13]MCP2619433.1 6-bladed beta-propeller [Candidatus Aminicenantes bacterium AC-335-K20]